MSDNLKKCLIISLPIFVIFSLYLVKEYFSGNADVRGWWQLVLVICAFYALFFGGIYVFLQKFYKNSLKFTIFFSIIFSIYFTIFVFIIPYFFPMEMLNLSNGKEILFYLFFLLLPFVILLFLNLQKK